jgi:malonyl-CoA O-methyltransferase
MKRVERPGVREGYDRWSETYDTTANPLVALDRRYTFDALEARPGEWVLDAGCGTGAHLASLCEARSRPVGLDFSRGMLRVAQRAAPRAAFARADLNRELPVRRGAFDVVLSALVSEHLTDLRSFFSEAFAALRRGGRLVFSAFHPQLAFGGVEANFELAGPSTASAPSAIPSTTTWATSRMPAFAASAGTSTVPTTASSRRCRWPRSTSAVRFSS